MRDLCVALLAALLAAFTTGGLVMVATAAPPPSPTTVAENELVSLLDQRLHHRLDALIAAIDEPITTTR